MKVLFMTNMPSPYRVDFFNELGKSCDLTVMFERDRDYSRDTRYVADQYKNFKVEFLKGFALGDAEAFCPGVIRLLSKKKFDHIIVGNYYSPTGMLAIEYMCLMHIPYILSSDGGMIKEDRGFKYKLKKHFIGSASSWLSTGRMTTDYLAYYGADREKTTVYPFTSLWKKDILDKPLTMNEKNTIRQRLGMTENKIVISVGQFIHRKGYDVLLKASERLNKNIGVYIIGGTPIEEYLQMKEELNLRRVHFVDFMNKQALAEYYKAADLFVLPTREDIWGLVVNEAMAYALPVITTTKCIAGLEMVENGVDGYIIESEDYLELANKSNYILSQDSQMMCENALLKAREYTIESMAKVHYETLCKIIKSKEQDK
ncbi:MAG: glycosyltransferase family 4 protein [Mediterraneibacter faecis]|nr:glycosyltransferase family 4 protein [Mediterraneibacter faecis]